MKRIDFQSTLQKLRTFYSSRKRVPSFSEMQHLFGYRSKGGVSCLVGHLLERGVLERDRTGKLLPTFHFRIFVQDCFLLVHLSPPIQRNSNTSYPANKRREPESLREP